jgi:hypothetical protein
MAEHALDDMKECSALARTLDEEAAQRERKKKDINCDARHDPRQQHDSR